MKPHCDLGLGPERLLSRTSASLVGSEILRIAGEIRALKASGRDVLDLSVGDFSPKQFPLPEALRRHIFDAFERGETNYPPSNGLPELRKAVAHVFARDLGLEYDADSVLIAGGAR
ncbi:MAG TPA: aminotransferase class I/II-fold pyridoxal phosphate-dependent enzyme, partial [Planctomycetota bacterium]|nr:aminotransferase class I/II-fold pyridoxal phosphate-dependent enzyme [Planctomycetota bacterium]